LISDQAQQTRLRKKYAQALEYLGVNPILAERPIIFVHQGDFFGWKEKE